MNLDKKKEFTIRVVYFKDTGKYYTEDAVRREFRDIGINDLPMCCMLDVVKWIRRLWQEDRQGEPLPGLASSGWDGYILVDCEEGYPCLILPNKLITEPSGRHSPAS